MTRDFIISKAIELIKLRTRRDNLTLMMLLGEQYNQQKTLLPQDIQNEISDITTDFRK